MTSPDRTAAAAGGPRIAPVELADRSANQQELLRRWRGDDAGNVFTTLAHNEALFQRWSPFAFHLLCRSGFDTRQRELVILRVAWRCGCGYEWAHHASIAEADAGLDGADLDRLAADSLDGWTGDDWALLRAVDELVGTHTLSDEAWAGVSAFLDEDTLIELPVLVGAYVLLAGALNALRVPLDDDLAGSISADRTEGAGA